MDQPLYLDERLAEKERARLKHVIARWLKRLLPALAYNGPPVTRQSVEAQLLQRPRFSLEAWGDYGPLHEVIAILEIIRQQLNLPNHNFIPADPLMVLMSSGYDIDDVYALIELEDRYAMKYRNEELKRIRNEQWTLGQFVKDLIQRGKDASVLKIMPPTRSNS